MTTAKSAREAWKNFERRVATLVGGVRVPVTGRGRGSAPDVEHSRWALELKYRAAWPATVIEAMKQAEASRKGDQVPVVIWGTKGKDTTDALVFMRLDDWLEATA